MRVCTENNCTWTCKYIYFKTDESETQGYQNILFFFNKTRDSQELTKVKYIMHMSEYGQTQQFELLVIPLVSLIVFAIVVLCKQDRDKF